MTGPRRWRTAAAVVTALSALGLASATPALADVEPNNVISQAEGPVGGGVPVLGTISTPDDADYYVIYAASQQQIHLTSTDLTNNSTNCLLVSLEDTNGRGVESDFTTPLGTNRYFVHVDYYDGSGCTVPLSYRFEVDPGGAVVGGPPLDHALSQTGEPNETAGQAIGPLAGDVNYIGAHETTNDEDWFYFYVPPGTHQFDLSTTQPSEGSSSCESEVTLYGSPTTSIQYATAGWALFAHINQTLTGPSQYFVRAGVEDDDCLGYRWQFRIETPAAVTSTLMTPPPPPPPPVAAPRRPRYSTGMTLRRRGARYSGRLSSGRTGCKIGRRVVLRRIGRGTTSYGSTYSQSDGTFSIKRPRRLQGSVYAMTVQRATSAAVCTSGRSPSIRG
jgi:hypothetical protein